MICVSKFKASDNSWNSDLLGESQKSKSVYEIETAELFDNVLSMIHSAKQKAEHQVNATIIELYWGIGESVSK